MSDKNYLIKLTPLEKFFFGGERTFGTGDETNYLVKSNYFPQQTGLLGMLRYELLLQNGLLTVGTGKKLNAEAANLIGDTGFRINGNNDFGVIKKISPLFLTKDNLRITANPLDTYNEPIEVNGVIKGFELKFDQSVPDIPDYDAKKGVFSGFVTEEGGVAYEYENIFIEDTQIGIHKKGDKDAFYKQTFYRMELGFSFAFFAKLDWEKFPKSAVLESNTVFMGGEKSAFKMEVIPVESWDVPTIPDLGSIVDNMKKDIKKVILDSHCYATPSIYDDCVFAISQTVDFRFLETAVADTENYNALSNSKNRKKPVRSEKYNLLKAGSILYVEASKLSDVEKELTKLTFQKIGYNQYSIYPKPLT